MCDSNSHQYQNPANYNSFAIFIKQNLKKICQQTGKSENELEKEILKNYRKAILCHYDHGASESMCPDWTRNKWDIFSSPCL